MDFLLNSMLEDLGYGSAEESDGQPEQEVPELRQSDLAANPSADLDREIALYEQQQIALIEKAENAHHSKDHNSLKFIPPQSNDKPRTSLQVQRQEEYSKPLYNINEDFRRISSIKNSHYTHHMKESSKSSAASHLGVHFPNKDPYSSMISEASADTGRSEYFSAISGDRSLQSMAASSSSSTPSYSLTPVQRRILKELHIPHASNNEEPMADSIVKQRPEHSQELQLRMSDRKENDEGKDSYDVRILASGSKVERKGQHSAHSSRDSMRLMVLRGWGALRKKKGDFKNVKSQ